MWPWVFYPWLDNGSSISCRLPFFKKKKEKEKKREASFKFEEASYNLFRVAINILFASSLTVQSGQRLAVLSITHMLTARGPQGTTYMPSLVLLGVFFSVYTWLHKGQGRRYQSRTKWLQMDQNKPQISYPPVTPNGSRTGSHVPQ